MKFKLTPKPILGTTRIVKRFAFLPVKLHATCIIWFETFYKHQKYQRRWIGYEGFFADNVFKYRWVTIDKFQKNVS